MSCQSPYHPYLQTSTIHPNTVNNTVPGLQTYGRQVCAWGWRHFRRLTMHTSSSLHGLAWHGFRTSWAVFLWGLGTGNQRYNVIYHARIRIDRHFYVIHLCCLIYMYIFFTYIIWKFTSGRKQAESRITDFEWVFHSTSTQAQYIIHILCRITAVLTYIFK